jgi:hypothetical protein
VSFVLRSSYRGTVFFNNPNQLGLHALVVASLMALIHRRINFGVIKVSIALTGCAYLALLSGSRAALGGIAVLLFLLVFSNPRVIVATTVAAIGLLTVGGPVTRAIDVAQDRALEDRHPDQSFAEERGYDRMVQHPEYMLVGAGEGDVDRFRDRATTAGEIHSSFATMVFSYGIVGLALFVAFLWRVVRGAPLRSALMLLPILVATLAHNGLRLTMLWVLLAIFLALQLPKKSLQ